jgi:hypothetical protein
LSAKLWFPDATRGVDRKRLRLTRVGFKSRAKPVDNRMVYANVIGAGRHEPWSIGVAISSLAWKLSGFDESNCHFSNGAVRGH